MSRFIVYSDLHLNLWKYGSYSHSDQSNSRLANQLGFLQRMCYYANNEGIKNLLFCGDFFHTPGSVKTEVLQGACKTLRWLKNAYDLNFVWLVGNHDQANRLGDIHSLDFLEEFGRFANSYVPICLEDMPPIWGLDYTEDTELLNTFLGQVDTCSEKSIILMHQGVSGIELNSKGFSLNEILKKNAIPNNILHAYAGHYHSYKAVHDRLTIPGSCQQLNWGDAEEKRGFLDVEIIGNNLHTKHIDSECFQFSKVQYEHDMKYKEYPITSFMKLMGVPRGEDVEAIKGYLYGQGVQTVEVEYIEEESKEVQAEAFDSFDQLFTDYVGNNKIEGRELEVGQSIMVGNYKHKVGLDETAEPRS